MDRKCREPDDGCQTEHDREGAAEQQRDKQAEDTDLQEHRADVERPSGRHLRRDGHRQHPVADADDHHRRPPERGEMRMREDVREHEAA